jgi:hypothetical protein
MVFVPYWFIDDRHTPRQRAVRIRASAESVIDVPPTKEK